MKASLPPGLPACAVVDLDAIRHNVATLLRRCPGAGVMAVVKADGYGHGLLPSARAALDGGASWLGVATLAEALALRSGGVTAPVLAWLTVPGDRFVEAVTQGVDLGVSARWSLDEVVAAARRSGRPARIHLKIDTGLTRNGCPAALWPDLVEAAAKCQADGLLEVAGAFSHYAQAEDRSHPSVAAQTAAFRDAVDAAQDRGLRFAVRHLANSSAALNNPGSWFDLIRPGLALYGLSPFDGAPEPQAWGLQPAMTLLARVAAVKHVAGGTGVSYGHVHTTAADTTTAVVPLGYADGIPRHASGRAPLWLRGRRHTIAGRVCMDQFVVDLQDAANSAGVVEGDPVVLFGDGTEGFPTAQEWAEAAGTISYEIVSRLGTRVPRRYLDRGAGAAAPDPASGALAAPADADGPAVADRSADGSGAAGQP